MIPFLIFGALMTQMLPITTNMSLEDVPYKKIEVEEAVGGRGGGGGRGRENEERRKSRLDKDAKSSEREARLVNDA